MTKKHPLRGTRKQFRDGFASFTARLGMGQDNQLAKSGYVAEGYVTRSNTELEDMYRTSWIVDRVVNVVAEDMIRGGIEIRSQMAPDKIDELMRAVRSAGIPGRFSDAIKWSRLYGGALAVILIDGQELSEPLDLEAVPQGGFKGLYVLDRHQVTPSDGKIDDIGPMLGYPESYRINLDVLTGETIHHSRAIRFIGAELPWQQRQSEQWWGGSVVDKLYDRLVALDSATHGTANMLYKSFLRVVGVDGLRQILQQGGRAEAGLLKQFQMIRQVQTNEGITLLDKNDTFTTHGWSFAGIYDAMQAFMEQIAGATGIPLVRLLGQSPKGFSTGEADLRTYYDTVSTLQDDDLRPAYDTVFRVLARSLWGEALPDDFAFEFRPLWQPSETDKATIATADAQNVAGLHTAGVLTRKMALTELRNAGRASGRFVSITDEDIAQAEKEDQAPPLPEGIDMFAPTGGDNG